MEITKYGLRIKGKEKPLGFQMSGSGNEEFANSIDIDLCEYEDNVWLVNTLKEAEKARDTKPEWYNVDYATPNHPSKDAELEVVEITMLVKTTGS
jgi:hypothetical protein